MILNEYGNVKGEKVKKLVSKRKYSSYYADHPGYRVVDEIDHGFWIAFTRAVSYDPLPDHLARCTEDEVRRITTKQ